jgi:hypothetical protein
LSRACGDFKGKVSKENEFRQGEEGEGASDVRVRDKGTESFNLLGAGTVSKVASGGVCESRAFSSLPSLEVARVGTMTSLSLCLVKPAKLPPPSHPLLLDGRAFWLTDELLPAVETSETAFFLLKVREDDFCIACRGDEGVSKVRVRDSDKSTAGLDVSDAGTVTKVESGGVCESGTFSSLASVGVARVGTMTSLTLDLVKPAKLRAPPPSHPLLLDGLALLLTDELLSAVE